jgi:hypothetical protein
LCVKTHYSVDDSQWGHVTNLTQPRERAQPYALEREEQAILDEVKAIEGRRRAEAQALSARAGAAFSTHRMEAVKLSIAVEAGLYKLNP